MAVGKGSIRRATRTLKEENKEKAVFAEPAATEPGEEAVPETAPAAAGETAAAENAAEPAKEEAPAAAAEVTAKAAPKTPAKRGRKPKTGAKSAAVKKTGTKAAAEKKPPVSRGRKPGPKTITKAAEDPAPQSYTQVSHIYSELPVHLL